MNIELSDLNIFASFCLPVVVAKLCRFLRPHGLLPTRLLCPWNFPGKNTGVMGLSFLLCEVSTLPEALYPSCVCVCAQSLPLCLTLCDPVDFSLPGSSVYGDSLGKNTGVGCHALLQGIFPTQGWNQHLLHYKQILYPASHLGSSCFPKQAT